MLYIKKMSFATQYLAIITILPQLRYDDSNPDKVTYGGSDWK